MKKRALLTNIFIIILMLSIVFVLLAFFEVFPASIRSTVLTASMTLALVSVALVDIIFPLIDNIGKFMQSNAYKVKTIVKIVFFIVAVVFLILTVKSVGVFKTQFLGIGLFCVAYLAQFFIDMDKKNKRQPIGDNNDGNDDDDDDDNNDCNPKEDQNEKYDENDFSDDDEFDNNYDN